MDINTITPGTRIHLEGWSDTEFTVVGTERVRDMFGAWRDVIAVAAIDSAIGGYAHPDEITEVLR